MTQKEILEFIVSPLFSGLVMAGILWLFRVPKTLSKTATTIDTLSECLTKLTTSVDRLTTATNKLEQRVDITDRVLSDIIGEAYDSRVVSEDRSKYPKVSRREREPCP